eukprot:349756-Rhodomonas_salina.1
MPSRVLTDICGTFWHRRASACADIAPAASRASVRPGRSSGWAKTSAGSRPPPSRPTLVLTLLLSDAGEADAKCVAARSCKPKCACALARPDVRHA